MVVALSRKAHGASDELAARTRLICRGRSDMDEPELTALREQAAQGSRDALDQLVELAAERGDRDELRRLADAGSTDALDQLIELAVEREDLDELRRLADAGSVTAREVLDELTEG